jgi:hypothetical protein
LFPSVAGTRRIRTEQGHWSKDVLKPINIGVAVFKFTLLECKGRSRRYLLQFSLYVVGVAGLDIFVKKKRKPFLLPDFRHISRVQCPVGRTPRGEATYY